jgi:FkbM family methyltransferase
MIGDTVERTLGLYRAWRCRAAPGAMGAFYRAGGNSLLFENLPVRSSDIVLDVGGYRGDWTAEMCWRYGSKSLVLEPVPEFAAQIAKRFEHNDRVVPIAAGLGARDETLEIALAADGSSSVRRALGVRQINVPIMGVESLFAEHHLDEVACTKINIEGAEYDLLDAAHERGLLARVRCLVIQFHDIGATTQERLARVREGMARTHDPGFSFDLVWERWDRKATHRV